MLLRTSEHWSPNLLSSLSFPRDSYILTAKLYQTCSRGNALSLHNVSTTLTPARIIGDPKPSCLTNHTKTKKQKKVTAYLTYGEVSRTRMLIRTYTHTYVCVYTCTHVYTCVRTHMYMCVHVCVPAHTRANSMSIWACPKDSLVWHTPTSRPILPYQLPYQKRWL